MLFAGTDFEAIKARLKERPILKMWNRKAKHYTFVGVGAWLSGIPEGFWQPQALKLYQLV
jgi:hypothetical protein